MGKITHLQLRQKKGMVNMAISVKPIRPIVEIDDPKSVSEICRSLVSKPTAREIQVSRRAVFYAKNAKREK